jgi:hypothetical protein
MVVIAGPVESPTLLHRERVDLNLGAVDHGPYHVAQEAGDGAATVIDKVVSTAHGAARSAIAAAIETATAAGHTVVAAGVAGKIQNLPSLAKIISNHTMMHTAEGELYREVLATEAEAAGLHPHRAVPGDDHVKVIAAIGKSAGRPWQKDHKEATAIALEALTTI